MFDWFWDFLYGISKSIFRLIDGLMACANILAGIDPMHYEGEEINLLTFLFRDENISLAFVVASIIAILLLTFFGVAAMIRAMVSEKSSMTPGQVAVKVAKTVLMFLFIPACMALLIYLTNVFMETLYQATLGGSPDGMGRFLAGAFGQDAKLPGVGSNFYLEEAFVYTDTDSVRMYLDLSDYDFFFSWLSGICVLIALAQALLNFVDRAISIVILYIVSPISMSTSLIDDGAHFKLWRDQFLVKFLTGYGCIVAINVYVLIVAALTSDKVVFFEEGFLNNLLKIAFIVGGAVSMQRIMGLIGNLVQAGAGTSEMMANSAAAGKFARVATGAAGFIKGAALAPFKAARGAYNFYKDSKQHGLGSTIGSRLGFKTDKDYGKMSKVQKEQRDEQMKKKEESRNRTNSGLAEGIANKVADAIQGKKNEGGEGNKNNNESKNKQNPMVNNSINNSLQNNKNKEQEGGKK